MADGGLNTLSLHELCEYVSRIADALELSNEVLKANAQLCREDLEFRREQATKADAEKEAILKMFMGGAPQSRPGQPPLEQIVDSATRRSRRRHEPPEPPEAA